MIKTRDLSFAFGTKKILNGINFEAQLGQVVEICGDNGSGKTTFLKNLAGLLTPSHGEVLINRFDTKTDFLKVKWAVAYVGVADGGFFTRLTGRQNLSLLTEFYGLSNLDLNRELDYLSRFLNLFKILDTPFAEMSSGMKQLLRITLALLSSRQVILLDEPLRSLDKKSRQGLIKILAEKSPQQLLVFSNHLDQDWQELKPKSYRLADGQLR